MAERLVDSLHKQFRPGSFKDTYRERVAELIKLKAEGEEIELPEPVEDGRRARRPDGGARGQPRQETKRSKTRSKARR